MAGTAFAVPAVKHPVYGQSRRFPYGLRSCTYRFKGCGAHRRTSMWFIPAKTPIKTKEIRNPIDSTGQKPWFVPLQADCQPIPTARRFPHPAVLRDGWGPSEPPPMENAKINQPHYGCGHRCAHVMVSSIRYADCIHTQTAALRPKSPISSSSGARSRPVCPRGRTTRRGTQRSRWRRAARRRTARA